MEKRRGTASMSRGHQTGQACIAAVVDDDLRRIARQGGSTGRHRIAEIQHPRASRSGVYVARSRQRNYDYRRGLSERELVGTRLRKGRNGRLEEAFARSRGEDEHSE